MSAINIAGVNFRGTDRAFRGFMPEKVLQMRGRGGGALCAAGTNHVAVIRKGDDGFSPWEKAHLVWSRTVPDTLLPVSERVSRAVAGREEDFVGMLGPVNHAKIWLSGAQAHGEFLVVTAQESALYRSNGHFVVYDSFNGGGAGNRMPRYIRNFKIAQAIELGRSFGLELPTLSQIEQLSQDHQLADFWGQLGLTQVLASKGGATEFVRVFLTDVDRSYGSRPKRLYPDDVSGKSCALIFLQQQL